LGPDDGGDEAGGAMAVDTSVVGRSTGASRVRIERGAVAIFADALKDRNPVYRDEQAAAAAGLPSIAAPPTFPFAMKQIGLASADQPPDTTGGTNPMHEVMSALYAKGGIVLHGEEEFRYHRPMVVGDVLIGEGVVTDIYEKDTASATMTFIVIETVWRDETNDEPVVTEVFNLIHRLAK